MLQTYTQQILRIGCRLHRNNLGVYARNVRLYYPYGQYTNLSVFWFVSLQCLRSSQHTDYVYNYWSARLINRATCGSTSLGFGFIFIIFWGGSSTNLQNCTIIFSFRICEPRHSFFTTALPSGFGRVVLWLTLLVDGLEVTDLISDVADNCLDREYAHNAYNCTRRSR